MSHEIPNWVVAVAIVAVLVVGFFVYRATAGKPNRVPEMMPGAYAPAGGQGFEQPMPGGPVGGTPTGGRR